MQYKFFSIPAISGDVAQFEEELNVFLRSHRILTVQRELVMNGAQSFWCCCVEFLDSDKNSSALSRGEKIDYRTVLNDDEFIRFRVLRDIRKSIADTDHIPAYAILVNEQLAELAKTAEITEKTLKELSGFGEKKFEKFGKRILSMWEEKQIEEGGTTV